MRVCLSVAIVDMTKNRTVSHSDGTKTNEPYFDWGSTERGFALAAFFYGYILTQFIGGVISAKFGGSLVRISRAFDNANNHLSLLKA